MLYLNKITSSAYQQFFLTGNQGENITINLRYMATQQCWVMDVKYNDFIAYGIRVTTAINMLSQWENIIPFGFSCITTDGLDPFYIDDFANQRASLYLLNQNDLEALRETYGI